VLTAEVARLFRFMEIKRRSSIHATPIAHADQELAGRAVAVAGKVAITLARPAGKPGISAVAPSSL